VTLSFRRSSYLACRDGLQPAGQPRAASRDHIILWSKDLGRSLDDLQSRADIDNTNIAYLGFSLGGAIASNLLAVEPRFKTAILSSGGFHIFDLLPEVDELNFAPHVHIPVLMLNGRYDESFPLEMSTRAMFHLLGTPNKDKNLVIYEAGHGDLPRGEETRQTLEWLDKHLGPVRHSLTSSSIPDPGVRH
jgi:predicted esterase